MLVVGFTKILHHILFRQFTKTLNQIFYLSRTNGNFEIYIPV